MHQTMRNRLPDFFSLFYTFAIHSLETHIIELPASDYFGAETRVMCSLDVELHQNAHTHIYATPFFIQYYFYSMSFGLLLSHAL